MPFPPSSHLGVHFTIFSYVPFSICLYSEQTMLSGVKNAFFVLSKTLWFLLQLCSGPTEPLISGDL